MLFHFLSGSFTCSNVQSLHCLFFCPPPFPFQLYKNTDMVTIEPNHPHFCSDKSLKKITNLKPNVIFVFEKMCEICS